MFDLLLFRTGQPLLATSGISWEDEAGKATVGIRRQTDAAGYSGLPLMFASPPLPLPLFNVTR